MLAVGAADQASAFPASTSDLHQTQWGATLAQPLRPQRGKCIGAWYSTHQVHYPDSLPGRCVSSFLNVDLLFWMGYSCAL